MEIDFMWNLFPIKIVDFSSLDNFLLVYWKEFWIELFSKRTRFNYFDKNNNKEDDDDDHKDDDDDE